MAVKTIIKYFFRSCIFWIQLIIVITFFFSFITEISAKEKVSKALEDRIQKLETNQQINKALLEKDKELKEILEKEIERSIVMQKQVMENATNTVNTVGNVTTVVTVFIGILVSILGLFGIKSFKDLRQEGKKNIDNISKKMEDYLIKVKIDQQQIEAISNGLNKLYKEAKSKHVETDFSKKDKKLTDAEKATLFDSALKMDIAEKFGIKLDETDYVKMSAKHFYENDYELAIEALKKAIDINPNDEIAYNNWAIALGKLERYEESIEKCKKAININTNNHIAYDNWGHALHDLERYEESIAKFKKAVDINSNYETAYVNWGASLEKLERYDESIAKFKKAIDIDSNDEIAYTNWGVSLIRLKRYDEAAEKFKKAININPNYADVYYNLACLYALEENIQLSCENLKMAINLDPKNKIYAESDDDFNNIRGSDCFKVLIKD